MKLKSIMLAAVLAAGSLASTAYAGTIDGVTTPDIVLEQNGASSNYWTAAFSNVPKNDLTGSFTDVFTFVPALTGGAWANGAVVNFALSGFGDIQNFSASLNGYAFNNLGNGFYSLDPVQLGAGQLTLTISGIVTEAGGSYGGNLNVLAVPEPETYAMMLGGLGLLGFMARRRKQRG